MEFAREEILKEQRRLAEKYNFDFETDTPLVGNFVYEPIDDVPACLKETSNSPKKPAEDAAQRKLTGKLLPFGICLQQISGISHNFYLDFSFDYHIQYA